VARGLELSQDDLARRAVIQALSCHFRVSKESLELAHLLDVDDYFAAEMKDLRRLAAEGLVELQPDWIIVTSKGRLLVRVVCAVFDRYLREREARAQYSKVI
jgi:oxygen-independent coproporphyrinogen-3 oxidase